MVIHRVDHLRKKVLLAMAPVSPSSWKTTRRPFYTEAVQGTCDESTDAALLLFFFFFYYVYYYETLAGPWGTCVSSSTVNSTRGLFFPPSFFFRITIITTWRESHYKLYSVMASDDDKNKTSSSSRVSASKSLDDEVLSRRVYMAPLIGDRWIYVTSKKGGGFNNNKAEGCV